MKKTEALALSLTLLVGCERAKTMVESNVNANSATAFQTEAVQNPPHSEHGYPKAQTGFHVPTPITNSSAAQVVTSHPELKELTPLLSLPIDSEQFQAFEKKYHLEIVHKGDSGSFSSGDQAYTLTFRDNRIVGIILKASPWPKGYGDPNWIAYTHPLPGSLSPNDGREDVIKKLGEPTQDSGNRWVEKSIVLWVHFQDEDTAIDAVWLSPAE